MKTIIGIYKITNPSNRIYIGLSQDIYRRWETYKQPSNIKQQKALYNSLKKYGWENHKFEILEECSKDFLSDREIYWINEFKSYYYENKKGLNLTRGGNFPPKQNKCKSEKHKLKISESLKGHKLTESTKQKIRLMRKNQIISKQSYKIGAEKRMKSYKLQNKFTNEIWTASSVKELVKNCPISTSSFYKILKNETKKYKIWRSDS